MFFQDQEGDSQYGWVLFEVLKWFLHSSFEKLYIWIQECVSCSLYICSAFRSSFKHFSISFALLHLAVQKYSLEDKPKVKMFLAFWSSCTFLFSSSFISSHSLGTNSLFTSLVGIKGHVTIAFHALGSIDRIKISIFFTKMKNVLPQTMEVGWEMHPLWMWFV